MNTLMNSIVSRLLWWKRLQPAVDEYTAPA